MSKREDVGHEKTLNTKPPLSKDTSVRYVKGVGPRRAQLLERLGVETIEDILYYFPWRYEDRKNLKKICDLTFGNPETTSGKVVSTRIITTPRKRMKIFELVVTDDTGFLKCIWFNQPYMKKYFKNGQKIILSGTVKGNSDTSRFRPPLLRFVAQKQSKTMGGAGTNLVNLSSGFEMENPDFEHLENEDKFIHTSRIVPVYKATEGFTPKQLRVMIFNIINTYSPLISDYMPEYILKRNTLMPLQWSIRETHFPESFDNVDALNKGLSPGHRRLIFDEFFLLELGLALMKKKKVSEKGISFSASADLSADRQVRWGEKDKSPLVDKFLKMLPFELTDAQKRVFNQIRADMESDLSMNRLIHGDVGCGKTVVALMSMLIAVDSGYQTCLMTPTEILAEQHYINIHRMVKGLGLAVTLMTSSSKSKSLEEISSGNAQIIIGTHSLIQEKLKFRNLGLAVIDEQHKFGVVQRASLRKKGFNPDILIMTATPIPRTLALTLYGDLDISLIDELPSGRKNIITKVFFPSQKDVVYSLMDRELSKGRQIYIVYPLIEDSEKLDLKCAVDGAEAFKKVFPTKNIGLVHGKIRHEDRQAIMASFNSHDIDILVATTVIEVGVDLPNASLMLIVHAERFGLAQLHQLRGRIGRGRYESYCALMAYLPFSEEAKRRLKIMESTGDGFKIAEEDLDIRGPGEFFGTRQSGIPDLKLANIIRDVQILEASRKEAFELADSSMSLKDYPLLEDAMQRKWEGRLELLKS